MTQINNTNQMVREFAKVLDQPAPLLKGEKLHTFRDDDGETVTVRTRELPGNQYIAVDNENPDVMGSGFSIIGAIANLFAKMPAAASEREERDDLAAKWDRARDYRKHEVA
jgi:hypothetical protein